MYDCSIKVTTILGLYHYHCHVTLQLHAAKFKNLPKRSVTCFIFFSHSLKTGGQSGHVQYIYAAVSPLVRFCTALRVSYIHVCVALVSACPLPLQ